MPVSPAQIALLESLMPDMKGSTQTFAGSLASQFKNNGSLTEKQQYWVNKLIDDAKLAAVMGPAEPARVGDLSGLVSMFRTAKKHIKFPAIVLKLPTKGNVRISIAGGASKTPGFIQLRQPSLDGEAWFGKVSPDGIYEPSHAVRADPILLEQLLELLEKISYSPAMTASDYGKLTGQCCFCMSTLTDAYSTAVGYGPTCAKTWGLPYGLKAPQPFAAEVV